MSDSHLVVVVASPAVIDRASARTRGYEWGSCWYCCCASGGSVCVLASCRSSAQVGVVTCRLDGVDGPAPQTDRRHDRCRHVGCKDARGREPQLVGAVGMEHEVGGAAGDVEGLQVGLAERDVAEPRAGGRRASRPAAAAWPAVDSAPALAVPRVERLAHPVGGALGPDLQHERVAQGPPQRGVEAGREAEVAADPGPAAGAPGPGQLGRRPRVARQHAGDTHRSAAHRPGPGRRPETRRPGRAARGRRRRPPSPARPRPPPAPRRRSAHRRSPRSTSRSGPRARSTSRPRRRGRSEGRWPARHRRRSGPPMRRARRAGLVGRARGRSGRPARRPTGG